MSHSSTQRFPLVDNYKPPETLWGTDEFLACKIYEGVRRNRHFGFLLKKIYDRYYTYTDWAIGGT
jgi:hypothetical protein